jgi:AraC-like DNA-binding protein
MNDADFESDLPLAMTNRYSSAEEQEDVLQSMGVRHEIRQLGAGRFRAQVGSLDTGQAEFVADRYNVACSFRLEPAPGTACLLLTRSAGGPVRALGTELTRRHLLLVPSGSGVHVLTTSPAGSEGVTLPQERLEQLIQVLSPGTELPNQAIVLEGQSPPLDTLRCAALKTLAPQTRAPNRESLSNIVSSVVAWLGDRLARQESDRLPGACSSWRVAREAQVFINEYYQEPLSLEDLCLTTEVSARTLQRHFGKHFGLSITDYLKAVRFDAARRALKASHPSERTVAEIALDHGFSHLGRFSVEFRERFRCSAHDLLSEH